jgi:hypothetical protein
LLITTELIIQDYEVEGYLTKSELFGWLTQVLSEKPSKLLEVLSNMSHNTELTKEFVQYLRRLKPDTEILHLGKVFSPSPELLRELGEETYLLGLYDPLWEGAPLMPS